MQEKLVFHEKFPIKITFLHINCVEFSQKELFFELENRSFL